MRLGLLGTRLFAAATVLAVAPAARAADPTALECISASERGMALRNAHKLGDARATLLQCASAACPSDIREECARRVETVNRAMPTLVFGAKDAAGNDVTVVKVTMDKAPILDKLEGTAISLEPGAHVFTFEAPGQPILTRDLVIREGEKERREIVQLGAPAPVAASVQAEKPRSSLGAQRTGALVVGGLGVAGLALGGILGGIALSKHIDAKATCPDPGCATQQGVDLWSSATLFGNAATASFIAGGVLAAGGVVLWVTAKPKSAQVGLGPRSVTFQGVF